ncbi:MAG: gamma-glutamyl-gamma-aminobutyrate hydrolase family protein [Sarcina sp.]
MKSKIIGISANIEIATDTVPFAGRKRVKLYTGYIDSVIKAGGIPIVIPVTTDKNILEEYINLIDGLIISGGYDVDPARYNEDPHSLLQTTFPERDEFEFTLAKLAMDKEIPLLGICRGHQILNVLNGGTLYQDISLKEDSFIKHAQSSHSTVVTHKINIEKDSMLYEILGDSTRVNSLHHLAIKDLAPGFKIVATANDGIIEAIEKEGNNFLMGVQWHPEVLSENNESMSNLFKYFIDKIN